MCRSKPRCLLQTKLGFTLIELLVVIVILGILMAVALPTFLRQQVKAQDSRTQQYLTTAFEAIRAGLPDTNNQYPASTSMVSWIQQSEPELTAQRGDCLTGVTSAPVDAVLVDPGSTANSLQLCARSQSGNIWKLTASATGAQQLLDGTLVPLTMSGNEITDATRAVGVQGDGLSNDSSTGIWEGTTNLAPNGGFETNTSSWTARGTGTTIARSMAGAKFGSASLKVSTPGNSGANPNGEGAILNNPLLTISPNTSYTASVWVYIAGGTPTVRLYWEEFNSSGGYIASHGLGGSVDNTSIVGQWIHLTTTATSSASGAKADVLVNYDAAAAPSIFYVDGVQFEQKPFATPYVETNGATATRNAARVQAPSSLLNATQGWVVMRAKMGWASGSPPSGYPRIFQWGSGSDQVYAWLGTNSLFPHRISGGTNIGGNAGTSFTAGGTTTFIIAWDATHLYASVNGATFSSWPATAPTITDTTFDVGSQGTVNLIDSSVLWFACGTGTLTDADAATINSWGNTDPARSSFPAAAQATMVWNGVGSTGSLK